MRTKQSASDPRRRRSATSGNRAPAISGELLNDEFSSYPAENTLSLAPPVLHYWGLLGSPFARPQGVAQPPQNKDFYFRSEAHVATWAWLENLARRPACLGMLTTSTGAGTTTLLRHLATTSGLGGTAVEIATRQWGTQSVTQLTDELSQSAGAVDSTDRVRALWLIEAIPRNQIGAGLQRAKALTNWYQAHSHVLTNLTVVMVIRKSTDHLRVISNVPRSISSHHLSRFTDHELSRCVGTAMHHVGSTCPAFPVAATERLAEVATGSISRLGRLVHTALLHGYTTGIRRVSRTDIGSRLNGESTPAHSRAA